MKNGAGRPIPKDEIATFLTAAREHKPQAVLFIATSTLTSGVKDWLDSVRSEYKFEIFVWEERDLERELRQHRRKLSFLPPSEPQSAKPISFYPENPLGEVYMSNEVEEVGFWVMNPEPISDDIRRIEEFIEFPRHHQITFDQADGKASNDDDEAE